MKNPGNIFQEISGKSFIFADFPSKLTEKHYKNSGTHEFGLPKHYKNSGTHELGLPKQYKNSGTHESGPPKHCKNNGTHDLGPPKHYKNSGTHESGLPRHYKNSGTHDSGAIFLEPESCVPLLSRAGLLRTCSLLEKNYFFDPNRKFLDKMFV